MMQDFGRSLSRYFQTFIVGIVLIFTASVMGISPALAQSWEEQINQKIVALKAAEEHWIEINLSSQRLVAWEGETPVYAVVVSTGKKATPTRPGIFNIKSKHRINRMRGTDYDVPDVPFTMYYDGGYAIHGAYWHNRFGTPVSHGCINLAVNHAEWLFKWTSLGTAVIIHY